MLCGVWLRQNQPSPLVRLAIGCGRASGHKAIRLLQGPSFETYLVSLDHAVERFAIDTQHAGGHTRAT